MTVSPELKWHLLIFLAPVGFMLATQYRAWCRVRPIIFRQKLFAIRDRLWDQARELNAFDDPAYQDLRTSIHGAIVAAPVLNVVMFKMFENRSPQRSPRPISSRPEVQRVVDQTEREVVEAVMDYVLKWHVSGRLLPLLRLTRQSIEVFAKQWVREEHPQICSELSNAA